MIVDNIKNAALYSGVSERIKKALAFLQESDFAAIEPGKYEIDGDNIYAFVNEYETKPFAECQWEAHKRYIDIQYIAKGIEQIGYAYINTLDVTKDYDEKDDYMLLKGKGNLLTCEEGTFAILDEDDAHMPGVAADGKQPVRKVIVKVKR